MSVKLIFYKLHDMVPQRYGLILKWIDNIRVTLLHLYYVNRV